VKNMKANGKKTKRVGKDLLYIKMGEYLNSYEKSAKNLNEHLLLFFNFFIFFNNFFYLFKKKND
jgi:hypothetical protein